MIVEKIMNMGDHNCSDGADEKSSETLTQDKGSRNKRKFLSEFPLDIPIDEPVLSLTEFPRYELLEEKLRSTLGELGSLEGKCLQSDEKQGVENVRNIDWDDPIASQLEQLLSRNLTATFRSAMKKLVEFGYTEEVAEWVILRNGLYHGSKDAVSTIVDRALALLTRDKVLDISTPLIFEDVDNLVEYTLLEMICVLREVKPAFTVAEAMWCLLICDLNLLHACAIERDHLGELRCQESPGEIPSGSKISQSKKEASETSQSNLDKPQVSNPSAPIAQSLQSEVPIAGAAPQLHNSKNPLPKVGVLAEKSSAPFPEVEKSSGISREHVLSLSKAAVLEDKSGAGRRGSSLNSKKDILRQKSFQFEKSYKGRMGKAAYKGKFSGWSSMVVEKKLNSLSGSSGVATKTKVTTSVKSIGLLAEGSSHSSRPSPSIAPASDTAGVADTAFALPAVNTKPPALPAVNTKPPASPVLEPKSSSKIPGSTPGFSKVLDYYAGIPYDESLGRYVPQNEKDEIILLLTPVMQTLQKELQGWTDWANEKVMQAARRLGKDQAELKMLRQEKDEAQKFQKDKQMLEESTNKRLSEMDYALANAGGQIEMANSTLLRLKAENTVLNKEMEAAKLAARRSATNLHEAAAREQEVLKKCQAWDMNKSLLQDDFSALKCETSDLQQNLEKAKKRYSQFEALSKQEEREKQRFLQQVHSLKAETEQIGVQLKGEEDNIRGMAESNMQKCKEDIQRLENEIAQLRLQSEGSKIEALRRGINVGLQSPNIPKSFAVFEDNFGSTSLKMDRECVMCLTEERSVVFLPCAHQVLCAQCNVLHDKQGMHDCPSCRTPIKERINVLFARPFSS